MYTEEQQWAMEQLELLAQKLGSLSKACVQVGMSQAVISTIKNG